MKLFSIVVIASWAVHLSFAMMQEYADSDLQITPMELMVIAEDENRIVVAARNRLYMLDLDLKLQMKKSTGPKLDHEQCSPLVEEPCESKRVPTDNDPKVLLISKALVYFCGTLYQGSCELFTPENIQSSSPVGQDRFQLSNLVAGRSSTVAIFGPGPGSQPNDTSFLYIAVSYDGRPLQFFPPAVSSRLLTHEIKNNEATFHLRYGYDSDTTRTAVNFHPDFRKSYKVNYVYAFKYDQFVYFVTTQRKSLVSEAMETRLARVCTNDPSFFSYTEIPLKCHRGDAYNLATAAYLGPAGSVLKSRLKMEGSSDVLYIAFCRTVPDHSDLVDESKGTVVCSFPMSQVNSYFTNASRDCYRAEPATHWLPHIVGDGIKCLRYSDPEATDVDFCSSSLNHYIEGREAIPGGVRVNVDHHVTALAVTLQKDKTVAFLGTRKGLVMKLLLEPGNGSPLYVEKIYDDYARRHAWSTEIQKSLAFDKNHQFLYLISGNKVVKFPAGSCSFYKTCGACLTTEDPLECGWCGTFCAHYHECEIHGLFTRESCPPIITSVNPLSGPTAGGTLVNITGDNFSSPSSGAVSSVITVTVAGVECEIIHWSVTKLKCRTAPVEEELTGPVEIKVVDNTWTLGSYDINGTAVSEVQFKYLVPRVFGAIPTYGPVSGGTPIYVYGANLHIGASYSVTVAGVKCSNVTRNTTNAGKEFFICISGPSSTLKRGPFEVMIDNTHLRAEGNYHRWVYYGKMGHEFEYKPDPQVTSYHPSATTVSGTVNITVIGTHLDSVYAPNSVIVMTVPITGKIIRIVQRCIVLNSTQMVCPTPPYSRTDLYIPKERAPLIAHYFFLLDGTDLVGMFHNAKDLPQLLYYPDPNYFAFETTPKLVTYDQEELEIKGKNIDLVHGPDNVHVLIDGNKPCNVTRMTSELLYCLIPPVDSLLTYNGSQHSVEVHIPPLKFYLGTIEYVEAESESKSPAVPIICSLAALAFIAFTMVLYCRKIRRRKLPNYMVAYADDTNENRGPCADLDYPSCGTRPNKRSRISNDYSSTQRAFSIGSASSMQQFPLDEEMVHLLKSENLMIDRSCLELKDVIGQGNFGCVQKAVLSLTGQKPMLVAVKTLRQNALKPGEPVVEQFLEEGLMMKDFKHLNVLGLIGVCLDESSFPMVITPYMKYGDLHKYIGDETKDPHVLQLLNFGIDIAKGMAYLSSSKFVHRDLAARNCMLGEDMIVKVADFGLSRDIYEKEYYCSDNKKKLPVRWMAIESLEKGVYSSSSDVWSYGVVLWELMTRGVTPYPDVGNWDMLTYLKAKRRMLQPICCPDLIYLIMLKCWQENPADRPTFDELVNAIQFAVNKYEAENKGRKQKVDLTVQYVNNPYRMLDEVARSKTEGMQEANAATNAAQDETGC